MSFVVRAATRDDVQQLLELARQFTLLNLPAERRRIEVKLERSEASFAGELGKAEAEYLFVVEDTEAEMVVGSSLIMAKNGTPGSPNFSFKVLKKERFSRELGIGFIHQILRLNVNTDGPTEVGGLVVDRAYRRRPEKVGRMISLSRFLYIGMHQERFEAELHSEMAPPLTEEGRSEFWEALGRRFTGMPYQEADQISGQNNGFIQSLFPEEDIYLALLDSKARLVLGRVGEETQPALHLLNRIGFKYKEEVDPFDGGPHLSCATTECTIVKGLKKYRLSAGRGGQFDGSSLVGLTRDGSYVGAASSYRIEGNDIVLPEKAWLLLNLSAGEEIYL
ncbi:MAG TPA: arginine N-succinyltransferase [Bdellovibrionales bacterium]|nr:arginine N-succinyltransferase [Bdellovibrionales bacterium]